MKTRSKWSACSLLVLLLGALAPAWAASDELESERSELRKTLRLEVAENGFLFVPDTEPVHNGDPFLPAYGGEFITGGYLYPAGTLTCGPDGAGGYVCDGVNEDGSPQYPEKVVGTWVCRGWHVGDGAFTETGAWTATNQIYSFTPAITQEYGRRTITTDGFESPEPTRLHRAITGGTGRFAGVSGVQIQKFMGWNPSIGVGLEIKFHFE